MPSDECILSMMGADPRPDDRKPFNKPKTQGTKMKVRAKMVVESVKQTVHAEEVGLSAVHGGTAEDNNYAEATPSASLIMWVNNIAVRGFFKPGQKFYVDFTEANT